MRNSSLISTKKSGVSSEKSSIPPETKFYCGGLLRSATRKPLDLLVLFAPTVTSPREKRPALDCLIVTFRGKNSTSTRFVLMWKKVKIELSKKQQSAKRKPMRSTNTVGSIDYCWVTDSNNSFAGATLFYLLVHDITESFDSQDNPPYLFREYFS